MNIDNETIRQLIEAAITDLNLKPVDGDNLIDLIADEVVDKVKTAIMDAYFKYKYLQTIKQPESGTPPLEH